ncbi:MAG: cytochrome c oxidase subunit 3 [Cryomorphaceae bacterium]|nr:cytochrome c oxidase subunit 3 [Cryomorphaceae bacterium]
MENPINHKSIFYPPGGLLIWVVILLEVVTFGIAIGGLAYYATLEPEVFHESRLKLNPVMGAINTVFLLISGYCMALAVKNYNLGNPRKTYLYFLGTILGGLLFIFVKYFEYKDKIDLGLYPDENMFFTFYWLLTGFHLVHVLVGIAILIIIFFNIHRNGSSSESVEAGAAFWHMCDLIWLLLFPALYLIL